MTRFSYRAVSAVGDLVSGEVEAANRAEATALVRRDGLDPLRVREGGASRLRALLETDIRIGRGREMRLVSAFTSDLAMLRKAGAPLDRALRVMAAGSDRSAALARRVLTRTASGLSLSGALEAETGVFDSADLAMVAAGEASGDLAEALETLAELTAARMAARGELRRALFYPCLLVIASVVTVGIVVFHVLPSLEGLFTRNGSTLPPMATFVFEAGATLRALAVPLGAGMGALVLLVGALLVTAHGRGLLDRAVLATPLVGAIARDSDLARAFLVASRLVAAGASADRAIELAGKSAANAVFREDLAHAAEAIRTGRPVASALGAVRHMPRRAADMIAIGETAGALARMLGDVATMLRRSAEAATAALIAALPPALTVGIGLVVAALVYAVLTVLLSVNQIAF